MVSSSVARWPKPLLVLRPMRLGKITSLQSPIGPQPLRPCRTTPPITYRRSSERQSEQ